jgi:hypothetical protein
MKNMWNNIWKDDDCSSIHRVLERLRTNAVEVTHYYCSCFRAIILPYLHQHYNYLAEF